MDDEIREARMNTSTGFENSNALQSRMIGGLAIAAMCLLASHPAQAQSGPLVVGADVGASPHVMAATDGSYEGINVDLATIVAKKLGRSDLKIIDQEWSGIFAGLDAKRYEFMIAPTTLTYERSTKMLFMEGYLNTDFQFLRRADAPEIKTLDAMKGKIIALNNGSASDGWATKNADQYGFKIERYGKTADAIQAVLTKRSDVFMSSNSNVGWAALKNSKVTPDLMIPSGLVFSWPFRIDDAETRNRVEGIIECLKLDGTVASIVEKWLGAGAAPPGSASRTVYVGYGHPGREGYDLTPHKLACD
jgi:polar amino acid transport system substrate-binding protein